MGRLDPEARMTIKTLAARGATNSHIARLLGVTEGAVRHHLARMQAGALDGRSRQEPKAACVAAAIDHWRQMQEEGPINLAVLHAWLVSEHGYSGSLRSIQRYWVRTYSAPAVRARRRVETPPGAQAQVDWAISRPSWAASPRISWPCTWFCRGAARRRSSGPRRRTCWPGSGARRPALPGLEACRRRCASTTRRLRWPAARARGGRSIRLIGAMRRFCTSML